MGRRGRSPYTRGRNATMPSVLRLWKGRGRAESQAGNGPTNGSRSHLTAGQVARQVKTLAVDDSLSRAAEVMRSTGLSVVPVTRDGYLVGGVSELSLGRALRTDPQNASAWSVEQALGDGLRVVPSAASLTEALSILEDSPQGVAVVSDYNGACQGVLTRADLMAAWSVGPKPPRIGGMATPLGVYLTGGGVQAGAGNLALMLTGATLWAFFVIVALGLHGLLTLGERMTGLPLLAALSSTPAGTLHFLDLLPVLVPALAAFGLTLVIRLSPIAGYHAAEHQAVWALEQGEPLVPDRVARMPRPHPRCGTNLMVALTAFAVLAPINPYLALVGCFLAFRHLGYYVQLYLTTRPASKRQLESGIWAAQQLLDRYQRRLATGRGVRLAQQIWNMGLLQVMVGFWLCQALLWLLGLELPLVL